jgi:hypothetical protein
MAITRTETQVTWPTAANSTSVAAAGTATSEEFNLDATCVAAQVSLKADNDAGSPASDAQVDFYLLQTSGDPDGASTDEFDTVGHAVFLGRADTATDDPAILTVPLPIPQKGAKIYASNVGATNAITVSATITEQRAA